MTVIPYDPGWLAHRVTLESADGTSDGAGGETVAWDTLATLWARIEPIGAGERVVAGHLSGVVTHRITFRHRDDIAGGMRVAYPWPHIPHPRRRGSRRDAIATSSPRPRRKSHEPRSIADRERSDRGAEPANRAASGRSRRRSARRGTGTRRGEGGRRQPPRSFAAAASEYEGRHPSAEPRADDASCARAADGGGRGAARRRQRRRTGRRPHLRRARPANATFPYVSRRRYARGRLEHRAPRRRRAPTRPRCVVARTRQAPVLDEIAEAIDAALQEAALALDGHVARQPAASSRRDSALDRDGITCIARRIASGR